jgi:hypothetical protein
MLVVGGVPERVLRLAHTAAEPPKPRGSGHSARTYLVAPKIPGLWAGQPPSASAARVPLFPQARLAADEEGEYLLGPQESLQTNHELQPQKPHRSQSSEPQLFSLETGTNLGRRHHLHTHGGRLAVSGDCQGFVPKESGRLRYGRPHRHRADPLGADNGRNAAKT